MLGPEFHLLFLQLELDVELREVERMVVLEQRKEIDVGGYRRDRRRRVLACTE
jgi:hypothetical protein